jgi:hypothetical protein
MTCVVPWAYNSGHRTVRKQSESATRVEADYAPEHTGKEIMAETTRRL